MFKIFFDTKVIQVGNHRNFGDIVENDNVFVYKENSNLQPILLRFISDKEAKELYIINQAEDKFWKDIYTNIKYKEAAGGVVYNIKDEVLVIKRFGKWDLPKGGIKKGETSRAAALREVEEETAINELKIVDIFPFTFHLYEHKDKLVLKKTYWFAMKTNTTAVPSPQTEEQIEEAKWISKEQLSEMKGNTWDSLIEVWDNIS